MNRLRGRRIGAVALALVAAAVCAGAAYLLLGVPSAGGPGDMTKLRLGVYAGDSAALVWIAAERGLLRDAGLDVRLQPFEAGKLAAEALVAGEVDVATAADFVVADTGLVVPDLRVLASIARADHLALVARRGRAIHGPADLAGKRVAVTRGSAGEYALGVFLMLEGLDLADVELVDRVPSALVESLAGGEVDAAFTWEPNVHELRSRLGDDALVLRDPVSSALHFLLVSRSAWLDAHPVAAQQLLRALVAAAAFVAREPDAASELLRRRLGRDAGYSTASWQRHHFEVGLSQALLYALEEQVRWLRAREAPPRGPLPNVLDLIEPRPLAAVAPGAVTFVR